MIDVLATVQIQKGRMVEFLEIFKAVIPDVLAEKGCREYRPAVDADSGLSVQELDDNSVTIIERWESLEDLHAHLSAPHMDAYREQVKDIVVNVTLKVLQSA